jgi:hypothetical protein
MWLLLHSELDLERTADAAAVWSIGDTMDVMCVGIFDGKPKLSRYVEGGTSVCLCLTSKRARQIVTWLTCLSENRATGAC